MDIGIFGLIKNKENKVLLVQDITRQQLWTLPGGGLKFQELLPDALKREVKEEAGVDIEVKTLLGIFSQKKTPGIVVLFEGVIVDGVPVHDNKETQAVGFFSMEDLLKMREKIKPAQLSMVYQVLNNEESEVPIYSEFISVPV